MSSELIFALWFILALGIYGVFFWKSTYHKLTTKSRIISAIASAFLMAICITESNLGFGPLVMGAVVIPFIVSGFVIVVLEHGL